jgi:hypothetical protein
MQLVVDSQAGGCSEIARVGISDQNNAWWYVGGYVEDSAPVAQAAPGRTMSPPSNSRLVKTARSGDLASQYLVDQQGGLFRMVGNQKCQITSGVSDVKIPAHTADPSMAYFVAGNTLFALDPGQPSGSCPKASKRKLVDDVAQFSLVSSSQSDLVMVALDRSGRLSMWDSAGDRTFLDGVSDFALNSCFGARGKAFSTYVGFAIDDSGNVTKLSGTIAGAPRPDGRSYSSLDEFRRGNRVCQ